MPLLLETGKVPKERLLFTLSLNNVPPAGPEAAARGGGVSALLRAA